MSEAQADSPEAPKDPPSPIDQVMPEKGEPMEGLTDEEKTWGMLGHLLVFVGYVGVPMGNLVGPAIAYFVKKDESKYVRFHAIQSFAFQLAIFAVVLVLVIPMIVVSVLIPPLFLLVLIPLSLLGLALSVYVIYMGIQANKGIPMKYPKIGDWAYKKVYEEDWKPL